MADPKAIVFDLDGTLIHSVPDMHVSLNRVMAAMGRETLSLEVATGFVGNGVEKLIERSLLATGVCDDALKQQAIEAFLSDYADQKTVLTRPYPGVVACLTALRQQGVSLAICTNKPQAPAVEICDALNLTHFFDSLRGALPEVEKKPAPASLLAVISELNCETRETLFVGDSLVDFQTAQNAKVPFRLYTEGYLNAPMPDMPSAHCFDDWSTVRFSL